MSGCHDPTINIEEKVMEQIYTPQIKEKVKGAIIQLMDDYENVIQSMKLDRSEISAATFCDINISIVTSLLINVLYILEEQFEEEFGEAISKRSVFESIQKNFFDYTKVH